MRFSYVTRHTLVACLVISGCATTPPDDANLGPRVLRDKELASTLRGRTIEGRQSDRSYVRAYCAPDGKVSALIDATDGQRYWSGGAWEVRGEAVCFAWRNRDWTSGCASVTLDGSGLIALKPLQGGPNIGSAKLLDGNPYSLGFN